MNLINFKALSRFLNEPNLRSNQVPKKYKPVIEELETILEYWKYKHFGKPSGKNTDTNK